MLTGGVGGAKLVDGLYRLLPEEGLTAIVNTGDDFSHYGLPISPDIDTLLYTLAGKANAKLGWGREGESWSFMAALKSLGGEDWFNLGDGDLALHVLRGAALARGERLSSVISAFARSWSLTLDILPMSDDVVATWIDSDEGDMPFQHYFVKRRCIPKVNAVRFEGAGLARPAPGVVEAIAQADGIIIAPSNPWLSIDPILEIPAIKTALDNATAPIVAVSPLVEGKAVKGPTAKLMVELGLEVNNHAIAEHYGSLLDGLIIHKSDEAPAKLEISRTDTMMRDANDRMRVGQAALNFLDQVRA